ncbi:uncharacterized protein LOC123558927 [Mercenaria mercenaria]|uniref:uncharacterized protein LOC123558927 n=1 Tax=Mercenaria mercenaria TaxID=6596 RepID=UPI00234EA072|nr:uncharacterized protein LOC123558927 [Mercenaria mercenaria]
MTYKGEPIIAASGITVDANCRRFAVDERREHFYRAEVQNRVYKREIIELDQEILRLERLMEIPVKPYPKLTKELLYALPESRVDPSPDVRRRWEQDRDLCCSISDAGDVCMGVSEDRSDDGHVEHGEDTRPRPKPFRRRANRLSIRVATNYAYTKLCKLRPRFSVGSVNYKHEYEDLKGSPTSPDGHLYHNIQIERSRSSHPLMRQEALELGQGGEMANVSKQDSEKSETQTCDTRVSDDAESEIAQEPIKFYVPQMDLLEVPSNTDLPGCEQKTLTKAYSAPIRRRRKYGNTLAVPPMQEACLITEVDTGTERRTSPRLRRARSILEHERRTRIRKLQSDLRRIQKELQNLNDLEYDVSEV